MGKWKLRAAAALGAVALSLFLSMPGASAACHSFSTEVSPASVQEGGTVSVVVSRDNGLADSHVRVSTVDGTAQGGSDFAPLNEEVNFTGSETQRSFQIQITDDSASEGPETFNVHLSDPGGCSVNPNFQLGPDRTVTIAASDAAAATTRPVAAVTTKPAAAATTAAATTTAPVTTTVAPATSPSIEPTPAETSDSGGGFPAWALILLIFLVLVAGGVVVTRRNKG